MNIEKWIKENTWRGHLSEQALRELLKTHAIVPRNIEERENINIVLAGLSELSINSFQTQVEVEKAYKAMIKAAESN